MLNFVLCDDNIKALNQLSNMFELIFAKNDLEANIAFKCTTDFELLDYVGKNGIDVLVLDINLHSQLSGLQIAEKIRKNDKDFYLIFITAHAEYVFLAYKYKVFDYICKPISLERIEETILRLFEDIQGISSKKKTYIKIDSKNTIIDSKEIIYIKRDGMKIIFNTKLKNYEVYSSFNKLQDQLPSNFVRCHKSFIVNINNIIKLEPSSNLIYLNNENKCDIGPKYKNDFIKEVKLYGNLK